MSNLYEQFLDFELEHDLFGPEIEDAPVWEQIRRKTFSQIQERTETGKAHTTITDSRWAHLISLKLLLTNITYRNPFFADESEILFVGHPRRKQLDDGLWWDIYCDPIHEALSDDYLHLEFAYNGTHLGPTPTSRLRYIDLIKYGGILQRKLGLRAPNISTGVETDLESATDNITEEFGVQVDVHTLAKQVFHDRAATLGAYRRLFQRVDPRLVVLVVSYGKETLIEACKSLNIPVVELQHGVIHDQHMGYAYPGERNKEMFPDYLLTFGEFWGEAVEFPIPDERVIPVGYPHLERSLKKYNEIESKDKMLFISQGTIGAELSKFAMEVAQNPKVDHDVVYKLHPGEYDRWEDEYPWLREANFEIVDSSDRQLYQLFAESSVQIGVGSTAVYEGLAFGLETYVYDCPGSSILQPLIDDGVASMVTTTDELTSRLGRGNDSFDREYYFSSDATTRACDAIRRISKNGTTQD